MGASGWKSTLIKLCRPLKLRGTIHKIRSSTTCLTVQVNSHVTSRLLLLPTLPMACQAATISPFPDKTGLMHQCRHQITWARRRSCKMDSHPSKDSKAYRKPRCRACKVNIDYHRRIRDLTCVSSCKLDRSPNNNARLCCINNNIMASSTARPLNPTTPLLATLMATTHNRPTCKTTPQC